MLYITNKVFNQDPSTIGSGAVVTYKKGDLIPQDTFYVVRHNLAANTHTVVGNITFNDELKRLHPGKHVLFYAHGFNVTADKALEGARKLQAGFDSTKVLVIPIVWGCEDSEVNFGERYFYDKPKAEYSGVAIGKFFRFWKITNPTVRCSIITHSMGNRMFCNVFRQLEILKEPTLHNNLFRNVFMIAADVVNEALEINQIGQRIPSSAKNVVIAYALDDLALEVSMFANYFDLTSTGRMIGQNGMQSWTLTPNNCVDVNCSNSNQQFDAVSGHTYFFPGSHLFKVIKQIIDTDSIYWNVGTSRSNFVVETLAAGL